MKTHIIIIGLAVSMVILSTGFTTTRQRSQTHREYTNLKVLPKDISSKNLQHIMIDEFEDGLGVGCAFCHAGQQGSGKLDYASDAKPEKEIARKMMRMTLKLNARYFQVHKPDWGILVITCSNCHQGKPRPDEQ